MEFMAWNCEVITSIAYNIANFNGGGDFHQSPEKQKVKKAPFMVQIILIAVLITLPA